MTRRMVVAAVVVAGLILTLAWCTHGDTTTPTPTPPPPAGASVPGATPTTSAGGAVNLPAPITTTTHPPAASPRPPARTLPHPSPTLRAWSPLEVAARWTAAACNYSWQDPAGRRETRQGRWSTPTFRRHLTASAAADWEAVVGGRVVSRCRVDGAAVMPAAPNTRTRTHVQVAVTLVVSRARVRPVRSPGFWQLRLERVGRQWLVDGTTTGG